MKRIGQIRENYDILTEKDDNETRKLTSLIRAGLFDAKKLPMLKRALAKDPKDLTPAERKVLIELLDSLMSEVLGSQQIYQKVRQDVMHESAEKYIKTTSDMNIPSIIVLKRKAFRIFPDNQKVAIYYSQALDRYVTIPFGTFTGEGSHGVFPQLKEEVSRPTVESMSIRERFKAKRQLQELSAAQVADIATDLTPGISNVKSAYSALQNAKAGQWGAAAVDAIGALPAVGNALKAVKTGAKVYKLTKAGEPAPKPAEPAPVKEPAPKPVKPDNDQPAPIKPPVPEKPAYTPPKPTEAPPKPANDPGGPSVVPKPDFKPFKPETPGPAPKPANVPEPTPAPSPKPATTPSPAPAPAPKPLSIPKQLPLKAPQEAPEVSPATAPATAPSTSTSSATAPATAPATAAASKLAPSSRTKADDAKVPPRPPRRPEIDSSPDSADLTNTYRPPAKFSLAPHLSSPKGDVRTGVQKREENLYRKALQKEEADTQTISYRTPAKFSMKARVSSPSTANTTVRTSVSARDAMLYRRSLQNESNLVKIKTIKENDELTITMGNDSVVINNTMANKILGVYESVNKENKVKIESMLNESVDSIKKIISFAVRQ